MSRIKIVMDAFGGDNAPLEVLRGARLAVDELDVDIVLCGIETQIREVAAANGVPIGDMSVLHAESVIPVEEAPSEIMKRYSDSSMAAALRLVAEGGADAFVSAGSTGAMVVGASMIVKRVKGVKRPAIATVVPMGTGCYMLIDMGANTECRPEMLRQFGIMGSAYMEKVMGIKSPRVGLVNIGAEETKGLELQREAFALLKKSPLHFIGNVEARELPLGGCDVAVADGFTGNVILKLTEGMGKMMMNELKGMLLSGTRNKIAAGMLKSELTGFKKKFDYTEYGGAPLMGIARPVIKAHGSSNANAFKNAVRQAKMVCEQHVIDEIEQAIAGLD